MNYEILAKNILHFPSLIELPESYIKFCNEEANREGIPTDQWVARGDTSEYVYGEMWVLPRSSSSEKIQNLLNLYDKALYSACEGFMEYLEIDRNSIDKSIEKLKNNKMPAITIKRYFEGESLGPHPDVDPNNTDDVLHLTVSLYYNSDYVGGDLMFEGGAGVKPTPGSVVIFPAKYLHESLTVSSGIKYVSNEVIKLDSSFLKV